MAPAKTKLKAVSADSGQGSDLAAAGRVLNYAAEALRAFCAERMADYKVPDVIELMAEPLPRNSNGKLQKTLLRERARAGR